jgi:DNA polymerase
MVAANLLVCRGISDIAKYRLGPELSASPESLGLESRRISLQRLTEGIRTCTRCPELVRSRTQTVIATGPIPAEVCFVGEAPGGDEDRQGEPFVGAAGQLLNKILKACGFKREEVYVCNVIKCRPPGNRMPTPEELLNCHNYFDSQMDLVRPNAICALGGTASKSLLGTRQRLDELRGRIHDYRGVPLICTYHPAFLLPHRSPQNKPLVWEDMKLLLRRIGRPIPVY